MNLYEKVNKILSALNQDLYERKEIMRLAFLATIAEESIFLLGPPGVAKSLIARRLKFAFKDATSFEYLMNRFSTPDEIFGPVSISKLKNEDKYERLTTNYLPDAQIVFLDEIWKASPSIQNAMLTVLNEKVYRNGEQEVPVKLRGIISASNELPEPNQGLEALWDRFIIRCFVKNIQSTNSFATYLSSKADVYADTVPSALKLNRTELSQWSSQIQQVILPDEVIQVIHNVRQEIIRYNEKNPETNLYASDRRWKKIVHILKTSAFLNERSSVDLMDCFLINHCIWDTESQIPVITSMLQEIIRKHGYSTRISFKELQENLQELDTEIKKEVFIIEKTTSSQKKKAVYDKLYYKIFQDYQYYYITIEDYNEFRNARGGRIILSLFQFNKGLYKAGKQIKTTLDPDGQTMIIRGLGNFTIEEQPLQSTTKVFKKPHPLIVENWDGKIQGLKQEVTQSLEKVDLIIQETKESLEKNLFVPKVNATYITENLSLLKTKIQKVDLKIDEVQEQYQSGHIISDTKHESNESEEVSDNEYNPLCFSCNQITKDPVATEGICEVCGAELQLNETIASIVDRINEPK